MRIHRFITALLALLVAATMTVGLTTTAAHAAEKAKRPLHYSAGEIRNSGKFQVHGKVGHYKKKVVTLQRKTRGGDWRKYNADRTDKHGKFHMRFDGPGGSKFRLKVPGDKHFKGRKEVIGQIVVS